jgi:hypothetical protein
MTVIYSMHYVVKQIYVKRNNVVDNNSEEIVKCLDGQIKILAYLLTYATYKLTTT